MAHLVGCPRSPYWSSVEAHKRLAAHRQSTSNAATLRCRFVSANVSVNRGVCLFGRNLALHGIGNVAPNAGGCIATTFLVCTPRSSGCRWGSCGLDNGNTHWKPPPERGKNEPEVGSLIAPQHATPRCLRLYHIRVHAVGSTASTIVRDTLRILRPKRRQQQCKQ